MTPSSQFTVSVGYPKDIATNFVGVPTDLDAASLYGDSGNAYFFKGDEYWRYDVRKSRVEHTLPMAIRVGWPGIGPPVDAAFQSSNGRQYFFSGDRYYRPENNSYPLDSASNWLECSNGDHGMGWIDVDDDRELCSLTTECISGIFDTITRTSDGNTYAFKGGLVAQLTEDGTGIVSGYPKPICAVFPGLPSNLDASILYPSGKSYFYKGDKYWRTTGTTVDSNYPRDIARGFLGVPINIDAALLYGDSGIAYFFKGKDYWRYNLRDQTVNHIFPLKIRDGWNGIDTHVDAAFQWSDGRQYFFNRGMYWKYNATGNRAEDGYPLPVTSSWLGCQEGDSEIDWTDVCEPDLCTARLASRCLSGKTDAITHILTGVSMGNIFAFRGSMVTKLTPATGDIVSGYPKPICSVFPGLPAGIDAALTWKDTGKTYFFKGNLCYRFSTFRLDKGYPRTISEEFPGVPNDIDAAVVTGESGNQYTYFFKDNGFYKYDRTTASVPLGYPQFIRTEWPGLPDDIDSAVQWINGWTYLFKDDQFYRWDYIKQKVARRYPRPTGSVWFGCKPLDEVNNCWVPQCF
ncbi:Matrix metalloproteinase-16 [Apostichopus japonicus]|uniref:Matrix metalloproteinase-16 n=1 Tax=Stichopus japonicus TaxID=307972 RepID=A0A2G8KIG4_STIJA|nr:Matrix metalloproteinase-16 [Apostichopus japonicus]